MKKLALFGVLTLSCVNGFGALSPFSQGLKEIREILDSAYLKDNFSQYYPIENIKLIEDTDAYRVYEVSSHELHFLAKVEYKNEHRMGPRMYDITWEVAQN